MALQPWRTGKIIRIEQETYNTRRYWIEVPELTSFDFVPGQFVTLDLPIHEKPNKRWRSYSIASWPDGTNVYELIILLLEGGAGSTWLFNDAKIGTEIPFRGAQGIFTLPPKIDTDIFLICTGTGIAPFRSMINYIHLHNIQISRNIYIIFGCRKKEDILYYNELTELQEKLPGFRYIPTLSREHWEGHHGYVHKIYEDLCTNKQDALFFLCGWRHMIDEAKKRITDMGYSKKSIHTELYG